MGGTPGFPHRAAAHRLLTLLWAALSLAFACSGQSPFSALRTFAERSPDSAGARSHEVADVQLLRSAEHTAEDRDRPLVDFVAGVIISAMAAALLWLNEGHAARMDQLLTFLQRRLKEVPASPAAAENVRQPVFLSGQGSTSDVLVIPDWCDLTAPPNSAKLRAMTFMYQWEEQREENKVSYKKVWRNHRVENRRFQEQFMENPAFPVTATCMALAKVQVGDFIVSKKMLGKLQDYLPCQIDKELLDKFQEKATLRLWRRGSPSHFNEGSLGISKPAIYFAKDSGLGTASAPDVGDLMVLFEYVPCSPLTLLGVQVPYDPQRSRILVPGTPCSVQGRPAEISKVTPPPEPFQVHFLDTLSPSYEWFEAEEISTDTVDSWPSQPGCYTFVPLQFSHKSLRPTLIRAYTGNTNLADEAGESLLGEDEDDNYVEEERSVLSHLQNGFTQTFKRLSSGHLNPVDLSTAFLSGSSPDEILLVFEGAYTYRQALDMEKRNERSINSAVRLFGVMLMAAGFRAMLRPLTWLCSFLWIFGSILIVALQTGTCLCAVACSGCTMATAWAAYRPLYALLLFFVPLAFVGLYHRLEEQDHAPHF